MTPVEKYLHVDDVRLAYFEYGERQANKPTLFFVHATGFHGRLWDYHVEALAGYHIIAFEQRGHGRSDNLAVTDWRTFGEDVAGAIAQLDLDRLIGIAHSMGGYAMIEGAAISGAFDRLLLLDPTVSAPENYGADPADLFGDELHPASKRRNQFSSTQDMLEQIQGKSSFPKFHPRILRDYCEHGLVQVESGGFELACQPRVEAHVYMYSRSSTAVFDSVEALKIPVTIVRARLPDPDNLHDFSSSPTWPGLAGMFANARDIHWSDCSHFIPMERPDAVITLIREEIALW